MEDKMARFYVWMMSVPVFHTRTHRNEGAGYFIFKCHKKTKKNFILVIFTLNFIILHFKHYY